MKKLTLLGIGLMLLTLSACQKTETAKVMVINDGVDTVEINTSWEDSGAYLLVGEEIFKATATGEVDLTTLGLYQINYFTDYEGIQYLTTRYVIVTDQTPPVIELLIGLDTITKGEPWTDAGATATDNSLEIIPVTVSGTVDTTTAGTYEIIYSATDSSGNTTSLTRYVTVVEP